MKLLPYIFILFLVVGAVIFLYKDIPHNTQSRQMVSSENEIDIMSERYMFSPMMVRLKKGRTMKIVLTTNDVPHGLNIPELNIALSAYPGKPATATVVPEKIGEFTAACSIYCGQDHNNMKMTFIVYE